MTQGPCMRPYKAGKKCPTLGFAHQYVQKRIYTHKYIYIYIHTYMYVHIYICIYNVNCKYTHDKQHVYASQLSNLCQRSWGSCLHVGSRYYKPQIINPRALNPRPPCSHQTTYTYIYIYSPIKVPPENTYQTQPSTKTYGLRHITCLLTTLKATFLARMASIPISMRSQSTNR